MFEAYVTDALKLTVSNTALFNGSQTLKVRYYDEIHPKPVNTKSGNEIAEDFITRHGLSIEGEDT